jgi:penicillin amidase
MVDNISQKNQKETRSQIVSESFKESVAALEKQLGSTVSSWTWNKVHTVEHQHPLGKVAALRGFFNVGLFEGSTEVINNLFLILLQMGIIP